MNFIGLKAGPGLLTAGVALAATVALAVWPDCGAAGLERRVARLERELAALRGRPAGPAATPGTTRTAAVPGPDAGPSPAAVGALPENAGDATPEMDEKGTIDDLAEGWSRDYFCEALGWDSTLTGPLEPLLRENAERLRAAAAAASLRLAPDAHDASGARSGQADGNSGASDAVKSLNADLQEAFYRQIEGRLTPAQRTALKDYFTEFGDRFTVESVEILDAWDPGRFGKILGDAERPALEAAVRELHEVDDRYRGDPAHLDRLKEKERELRVSLLARAEATLPPDKMKKLRNRFTDLDRF